MREENNKNKGEFYIAYPLQYPLSERELRCLHITYKDVTWLGKIRRPYYMVPCNDWELSRTCTKEFDNSRKEEADYTRCPNEDFTGICRNKCSECAKPRRGRFIPMSTCTRKESEYFEDTGDDKRTEDRIDLSIIIDKIETENPNYARYLRKLREMNIAELSTFENKAHSTVCEGRDLAIKLAISIYNGEKDNNKKGENK